MHNTKYKYECDTNSGPSREMKHHFISFYPQSSSSQTAERYAFCVYCNSYMKTCALALEICIGRDAHMDISGKCMNVSKYKMKNCREIKLTTNTYISKGII